MKKIILITICLLFTFSLAACDKGISQNKVSEKKDLIVVGFSQVGAESDWRNANTKSMMEALSPENGYRLIIEDAQQKQEKQITSIRNFINLGVDYIVLAPTKETGWDTVLSEAKAANIPVIIVDRAIVTDNTKLFSCWVGSDFLSEGEKAISWMNDNLQNKPLKIVHLQGNIGSTAQIGRTNALNKALTDHKNWEIVFCESGDFTQAKGQELMESILSSEIEFNVIYSENDNMTFGAIEALEKSGIIPGKDVAIISFDASSKALNLMLEGKINYDIECNPLHGPRVKNIIEELERNETINKYTFVEETAFEAGSITKELIKSRGY